MEEMNHFRHKDHSLKLVENWEEIIGGVDLEKEVVCCYGCQEPILDGSAYGCIPCRYFLHKTCTQLESTLDHHLHFQHPLKLIACDPNRSWNCDVCGHRDLKGGFRYRCSRCDFDACTKCAIAEVVLKEEVDIKFEHEGHPNHTLTLQLRPAAFLCDVCKTDNKDFFYRCNDCTFWIHKTCATLAPEIHLPHHHHHPFFLAYSLPDNFYDFTFYCEFCMKKILRSYWVYHCANCRMFAHIKCALSELEKPSTPRDDQDTSNVKEETNDDLLHFPMSEAFIDPLKQLNLEKITGDGDDNGETEISHWSHNCSLVLNVESQGNNVLDINCNDPIEVCYGCVRPLSFPYYSCKEECRFFLHKYCAELPRTLDHQLHPNHLLDLIHFDDPDYLTYKCNGCTTFGNTFVYKCKTCKFCLDVNCAYLPNIIKHVSHDHHLTQSIGSKIICKACNRWKDSVVYYACKDCDFHLDMFCAVMSPLFLAHRYCKGHQVSLTYPPIEDHPEDFYCDICEKLMHPKFPLYHCHKCKNSFHLGCLRHSDWYGNVEIEGTVSVSYHKHPITRVRRKKTPKYVCSNCNLDINGHLILECNARVCNFRICMSCHRVKTGRM